MEPEIIESPSSAIYPVDLLKGGLTRNIIRLSLPLMIAMLIQTGFSIIDMYELIRYNSSTIDPTIKL